MHAQAKRVAIVGTAGSWKQTPWNDIGVQVWSLNDAYRMPGFVRADAWFDFHPVDKFFHPPSDQPVFAHQVPPGHYVRPKEHVAWLGTQAQTIPVYLHPDYLTQCPQAKDWPHAKPFPKAEIEAVFGRYFTSSPAWMLALAILQGATEVHIYGIHLSTEHEYIEQRPQFEFLIGRFLNGPSLTVETKDGLRTYRSGDRTLVLPESSPILQSNFQYAFEPRPRSFVEPLKWDLHRYQVKASREMQRLRQAKPWTPTGQIKRDLERYEALVADTQEQMQRMNAAQQIGG
jgi:hypothetical protein